MGAHEYKLDETTYKKKAIKAARELGYSGTVIKQLKEAKTDVELTRIMKTARMRSFRDK